MRARSPSLLARQKSIGEFVREAAAFSTARDSEASSTRLRRDPTSEPPPSTPLMRAKVRQREEQDLHRKKEIRMQTGKKKSEKAPMVL